MDKEHYWLDIWDKDQQEVLVSFVVSNYFLEDTAAVIEEYYDDGFAGYEKGETVKNLLVKLFYDGGMEAIKKFLKPLLEMRHEKGMKQVEKEMGKEQ